MLLANIREVVRIKINKNLKFKKGVGIAIKSKETSSKLAISVADHANITPAG